MRTLFLLAVVMQLPAAEVEALLRAKCGDCHNAKTMASGFSIETLERVIAGGKKHGRAVVGGDPAGSVLLQMVRGELAPKMPMGRSLEPAEIATIEAWVKSLPPERATAKQQWKWPYTKPVQAELPVVRNQTWGRNAVDRFILAKLEQNGIAPAAEASPRTLARRLYLDLIGVPPTPAEVEEFLKTPYEQVVDKLLADPRYGERWGRHWLDVARYGETSGLEGDGAIGNAWRYRDWVIDAFNSNMPYDRFVTLQLAGGDEHSKTRNNYQPDVQGYVPTGFLRVAPWDRSNLVAADVRQNYLAEVTGTVGSVFLGLSVGCARCHDHKYDPIPTKDYYRLQSFFQASEARGGITVPYRDPDFAAKAAAKVKEYEERLNSGPEKKELDAFEKQLLTKLIAARIERAKKNAEFTKADLRLELRLPVEKRKVRGIFTEAEVREYMDRLEDAERTLDADEQQALDKVEAPMLQKLRKAYATVDPGPRFEALTQDDVRREAMAEYSGKSIFTADEKARYGQLAGDLAVYRRRLERWKPEVLAIGNVPGPPTGPEIAPTHVLLRGDYRQPGEAVEAGFPIAFGGDGGPAKLETDRYRQFVTRGRRLTLAKWIASKDNPQTARVWVNRLWQQHFGNGIVKTTSDFGVNGERPTHPELLDWLAVAFMDSNWDTKAMQKMLVTSATYRQSAENAGALKADPENRLFSKYNRRRLEAEAIRDSILSVSGRLNPERGGPSVFPPLPSDLADAARYGRTGDLMWEPNEKDADGRRRSVYIFQRRSLPLPMMVAFDSFAFSESCDRRSSTTTPLQALAMMNGYLVQEESEELAKRIAKEAGSKREDQIRRLFEVVLQRPPKPAELDRFASYTGGLDGLGRILMNSNEFLYVE
ncbi:PSD1 and planctomycete cytochrome C domain-containing protein [Bryobacter aggregatus]|uniref:PSD1 and planctomycete cytochrome C domain-containing protein n=1 Tax=Bryobacter aggregatus TaxID=360054 RepID=UPI00068B28BE|nr:PSD1 and planctomycete cytochrome C domain-containing protein [Bryobacter aggregatus]